LASSSKRSPPTHTQARLVKSGETLEHAPQLPKRLQLRCERLAELSSSSTPSSRQTRLQHDGAVQHSSLPRGTPQAYILPTYCEHPLTASKQDRASLPFSSLSLQLGKQTSPCMEADMSHLSIQNSTR